MLIACPDQRDGDAQLVAGVEDRSFDQIIRPELPARFGGTQAFALDRKRRRPRRDRDALDEREVADDVVGEAVSEVLVRRIALVLERQNGDGQSLFDPGASTTTPPRSPRAREPRRRRQSNGSG